jgi:hypothetical protein
MKEVLISQLKVMALHRYWISANRLREKFEEALVCPAWNQRFKEASEQGPVAAALCVFSDDPGIFMNQWYGALFVVVEGWRELKLKDKEIDGLLKDKKVELLKRYRNGVYHFQAKYFNERLSNFAAEKDSVPWVRQLNSAFGRYFLEVLDERRRQTQKPTS